MNTYINSTGFYVPAARIPNSYFADLYGKPEEWFTQRTGIRTRSRATDAETLNYMTIKAVEHAFDSAPFGVGEVDLIVFASYSPDDTVGTTGHVVQRHFGIEGARVMYVSSACSSAMNAVEIVRAFFASGISRRALLIAGDRNSTYSDDADPAHGHLWGDGAVAYVMSTERFSGASAAPAGSAAPASAAGSTGSEVSVAGSGSAVLAAPVSGSAAAPAGDWELLDIETQGLGQVGAGPDGVFLKPRTLGIGMPAGRDVFNQACVYIERFTRLILERNSLTVNDLDWFVSHQANLRIVSHVCRELGLPMERTLNNIEELGNTGCGSSLLSLAQHRAQLRPGDRIVVATFGGGYSVGAMLLEVKS